MFKDAIATAARSETRAMPLLALDDMVLEDAVLRVLAALPGPAAPAAADGGREQIVFRPVSSSAPADTTVALGCAAAAQAVIGLLGAAAGLSHLVLHVGWQAGVDAASGEGEDDGAAALAAVLEYCAALGLARCVGELSAAGTDASPERGWHVRAEIEGLDNGAATTWPLAFDAQAGRSRLLLIAPGDARDGLRESALARVYGQGGAVDARGSADGPSADAVEALAAALLALAARGKIRAGASRGAGGLLACIAGMALAGPVGVAVNVDLLAIDGDGVSDGRMDSGEVKNWAQQISGRRAELTLRALFAEAPGVVLQIRVEDTREVMEVVRDHGLGRCSTFIGAPAGKATDRDSAAAPVLSVWRDALQIFSAPLEELAHPDPAARAARRAGMVPPEPVRKAEVHEEKTREMRLGI